MSWCWAALPALAVGPAGCATTQVKWTPFEKDSAVVYYYDTGSIRHYADGRVKATILEDHAGPVLDRRTGQDYVSVQQTWQFNCTAKTVSRLSVVQFSGPKGTGANLSETSDPYLSIYADPQTLQAHSRETPEDAPASGENIAPRSPEEAMFKTLCG